MLSAILKSAETVAKSSNICVTADEVLRIVAMYQTELEKNTKESTHQALADAVKERVRAPEPTYPGMG